MEQRELEQEMQRLRPLLRRIYLHFIPTPDTEELQAELEREVLSIAVREGRRGPDGPTRAQNCASVTPAERSTA
jgi:hypothetical protein